MSDETHEFPKDSVSKKGSIFHIAFAWLTALAAWIAAFAVLSWRSDVCYVLNIKGTKMSNEFKYVKHKEIQEEGREFYIELGWLAAASVATSTVPSTV
jgi:hypothetical protein